jgi:hypothetical protein
MSSESGESKHEGASFAEDCGAAEGRNSVVVKIGLVGDAQVITIHTGASFNLK